MPFYYTLTKLMKGREIFVILINFDFFLFIYIWPHTFKFGISWKLNNLLKLKVKFSLLRWLLWEVTSDLWLSKFLSGASIIANFSFGMWLYTFLLPFSNVFLISAFSGKEHSNVKENKQHLFQHTTICNSSQTFEAGLNLNILLLIQFYTT